MVFSYMLVVPRSNYREQRLQCGCTRSPPSIDPIPALWVVCIYRYPVLGGIRIILSLSPSFLFLLHHFYRVTEHRVLLLLLPLHTTSSSRSPSLHSIIGASAANHLSLHLLQVCLTGATSSAPNHCQQSCRMIRVHAGHGKSFLANALDTTIVGAIYASRIATGSLTFSTTNTTTTTTH